MNKYMPVLFLAVLVVCTGLARPGAAYGQMKVPSRPDPARREMEESERRRDLERLMRGPSLAPRTSTPMFRASLEVMNLKAKTIKSVAWEVSLLDRDSGELIRKYDVVSKTTIAPGKTKTLRKHLPLPRVRVVDADTSGNKPPSTVAKVVPIVKSVTYEDGSSADMPAPVP